LTCRRCAGHPQRRTDHAKLVRLHHDRTLGHPLYRVTSGLECRVSQHKEKAIDGFTKRYNLTSLVYYEVHEDITVAIAREKQIKGWNRAKKIVLIESVNPQRRDLSEEW